MNQDKKGCGQGRISTIFSGFDFYGAGNIGDDLMLHGFIQALSYLKLDMGTKFYATTRWNLESQQLRFPEISWLKRESLSNTAVLDFLQSGTWVGVGDTPFQFTRGAWFLKFLLSELEVIKKFRRKSLVCIGAEAEIRPAAEDFSLVANVFERISTRDENSSWIIKDLLKVEHCNIFTGADLANISLSEICNQDFPDNEFDLGLIIAGDTLSNRDMSEIRSFISSYRGSIAFIACETRLASFGERSVFKNLAKFPQSIYRPKAILKVPPYERGSIYDLVQPIRACTTVISSRYHGLLAAAWSGCKVAGIDRSSKVSALTNILGVPHCPLPITAKKLEYLYQGAAEVPMDTLVRLKERAVEGVAFALDAT